VVDQRLGLSEAASAAEQRMQLSEKAAQLSQKVQAADLRLQISAKAQELSQDWQAFRDKAEPWMSWTLILHSGHGSRMSNLMFAYASHDLSKSFGNNLS